MADQLSAQEREAIDKAIENGLTQKIPRGESGLTSYIYSREKKGLVSVDEMSGKATGWKAMNWGKKRKRVTPGQAKRRVKVVELLQQGLTQQEVADRLGVSKQVVSRDAKAMNYTNTRDSLDTRRAEVMKLHRQGMNGPEIAKALGISTSQVYSDGDALEVHITRAVPNMKRKSVEEVQREYEELERMAGEGMSSTAIGKALNLAPRRVREMAKRSGVKLAPAPKGPQKGKTLAERLEKMQTARDKKLMETADTIRGLADGNRTISEISRLAGVSRETARRHLIAMNLPIGKGAPGRPISQEEKDRVWGRRNQIPALIEKGWTGPELAAHFKTSTYTISRDCRALGVRIPRRNPGGKGEKK